MSDEPADAVPGHDPYSALRLREFRRYLSGNVLAVLGAQMQTVAVGWEIYERTESKLALGLVGLVQFLPVAVLALPAGHVADRYVRKRIVMTALAVMASASLALAWISLRRLDPRWMYACLLVSGIARAFQQPAKAALLPQIAPREHFANAVTWSTGGFHLASVLGPALGGLLLAWRQTAGIVYAADAAATLGFLALLGAVRPRAMPARQQLSISRELAAGLAFLRRNRIVLAAITLDMFAVLLGGATTLLPVFAQDILLVGPGGLGWLRTAPALGALAMSFVLAHRPPMARAGTALLGAVAGFGVATILFGLSRVYWLSWAMLFLVGALDDISVVVRHTLVQMTTPDELRGRVSAVNGLFIGASNELGGFESGVVAALFGPVVSVVAGGIGTLLVVLAVALAWPQLHRYGDPNAGPRRDPRSAAD